MKFENQNKSRSNLNSARGTAANLEKLKLKFKAAKSERGGSFSGTVLPDHQSKAENMKIDCANMVAEVMM